MVSCGIKLYHCFHLRIFWFFGDVEILLGVFQHAVQLRLCLEGRAIIRDALDSSVVFCCCFCQSGVQLLIRKAIAKQKFSNSI